MANTHVYTREVRFLVEEELLQVYVRMDAYIDVPIGIQGWHHKTFGKSVSCLDVLNGWAKGTDGYDPILWPQEAPRA